MNEANEILMISNGKEILVSVFQNARNERDFKYLVPFLSLLKNSLTHDMLYLTLFIDILSVFKIAMSRIVCMVTKVVLPAKNKLASSLYFSLKSQERANYTARIARQTGHSCYTLLP